MQQATVETADRDRPGVVTTSPNVKDVDVTQQYACTIDARRHIEVRSLQNGYLEEVPLKEGQSVKQGDVLFKVAPALYLAKLDAELAEAKLAELEFSDAEKLLNDKVISKVEMERSQAKRDGAQARAKLAQAELNFTVVRAPFDGLVDRMGKQPGSLITERDVLTTLSDSSVMWVYFNMPESKYLEYMASRDKGEEAEQVDLKLADGSMYRHPGKVAAIEAEANSETGTIAFRADFPNPDGLLRHGQTGTVKIHRVLKDATVIPRRAAFELLDKQYVYVVDEDDVARRREIVVQSEPGDFLVVERGLSVDDRIVLDGVGQVRDGEKVSAEFRKPEEVVASPHRRAPAGGL
ncbi:MAG: efflux transporter periplasmic adaptor subunit [Planctomycetales bacterium 71-10]|nr:MAG: efflux transporter periplasmic adaptor subunit [Planctomycetales bacterium 71-10]